LAVGNYTFVSEHNIGSVPALLMRGLLVFGVASLVSVHLADNKEK
jgi:hypothetical protein